MDKMNCHLDMDYPAVQTSGQNIYYASLLTQDFAGAGGEMSAITQYFYQHLITLNQHIEFADSLKCISMVEMHHLDIIGQLIMLYGGDPQIKTVIPNRCHYWSSNHLSTTKTIQVFIRQNIISETKAISAYKTRLKQLNDPLAQPIIERIIMDEEHHIEIFETWLKSFS